MLSYKKWKKLNENVAGGSFTLGLNQRQKISELQSRWDEMGVSMPPMKMQSKKSKKMGSMGGSMDDAGPMGGGGMGGPPPSMKKKGKKPPFGGGGHGHGGPPDDAGPMDDDEPMDDAGPMDDEGPDDDAGPMDGPMGDEGPDDGPMGGPDDDAGPDDDDDGPPDLGDDGGDDLDADADMDDDDDAGPGMGGPDAGPAPAPKKKGGSFIDKTAAVADGAKLMHKGARKMIKGMKESAKTNEECKCCSQKSKKMGAWDKSHKMTKEEYEFFKSLQAQTGGVRFEKDETGAWNPVQEDAVLPPTDPNAGLTDQEPGPGSVGYAPQGRVGSFTEWAEKYKRKGRKINESVKNKGKNKNTSWFGQ